MQRTCRGGRESSDVAHAAPYPALAVLAVTVVAVAVLPLAPFAALLGFDREGGYRSRLEALDADFLAGFQTVAVAAVLDALQGLIDLADKLAFTVACAQLEAELLLLRGAIVRIGEIRCLVLHVRHGAIHFFHQIALPTQQNLAEVLELLLAHVRFAALRDVRLDVARSCEEAAGLAAVALLGFLGHEGRGDPQRNDRRGCGSRGCGAWRARAARMGGCRLSGFARRFGRRRLFRLRRGSAQRNDAL